MIKSSLKKILFIPLIVILFSSNSYGFEEKNHDLFYKVITDKNNFNENITQIEFLVFLARALNFTDDFASKNQVSSITNIPQWAEQEVKQVENKFGKLVPFYFSSFDPNAKLTKKTASKFLFAYLDLNNNDLEQNEEIQYNIGFYTDEIGNKAMQEYDIFTNDNKIFLTKFEISNALVKVNELREKRLYSNQNKYNTRFSSYNSDISGMNTTQISLIDDNEISDSLIEANFGASNNYVWRGMEQTNNGSPAIFGGIDIGFENNLYIGSWLSNVGFEDNTTYEIDLYGGYSNSFKLITDIDWDLGAIYYAYPDSASLESIDFSEAYLSLSAFNLTLIYYVLIDGPNQADFGNDSYLNLSTAFEINQDTSLNFATGYYKGETMINGEQFDFMIGLTKKQFSFSLITNNDEDSDPIFQIKYEIEI